MGGSGQRWVQRVYAAVCATHQPISVPHMKRTASRRTCCVWAVCGLCVYTAHRLLSTTHCAVPEFPLVPTHTSPGAFGATLNFEFLTPAFNSVTVFIFATSIVPHFPFSPSSPFLSSLVHHGGPARAAGSSSPANSPFHTQEVDPRNVRRLHHLLHARVEAQAHNSSKRACRGLVGRRLHGIPRKSGPTLRSSVSHCHSHRLFTCTGFRVLVQSRCEGTGVHQIHNFRRGGQSCYHGCRRCGLGLSRNSRIGKRLARAYGYRCNPCLLRSHTTGSAQPF